MHTALRLAEGGPATGVNPRVGCVIVDDEGRTRAAPAARRRS